MSPGSEFSGVPMTFKQRFLGLELAGAKNQKTSLAVLEFYPKERKLFLLDIFDRISAHEDQSSDEAVLEVIREESSENTYLGVNVPLNLPPCIPCQRKTCPLPAHCTVPAVKWMREITEQVQGRPFTPYTQRPIELWVRHLILPRLSDSALFEVDEALGGNKAPLTARMQFLNRHLPSLSIVEVWTKLTVAILATQMKIPSRTLASYRHIEDGINAREEILTHLVKHWELFIYERDLRKLSMSLTAFDAFVCAFTAFLSETKMCAPIPKGFSSSFGWIQYPLF
jgi:hypothetical protein